MAEEIDLVQFSAILEFQEPRDLDLDLVSGHGHISMCNIYIGLCSTTSMPDRMTLSSSNTEILPLEIRVISVKFELM